MSGELQIKEWIERELSDDMPVFVSEGLIKAGAEPSDEALLTFLKNRHAESGFYEFGIKWRVKDLENIDADALAVELITGFQDVMRRVHRCRQLLRAARS